MDSSEDEVDNQSTDERKGCRSLLCDANGIIIAEMVYRCMICYSIHDFIGDVSKHYHTVHMNDEDDQEEDQLKEDEEDQQKSCNNDYLNDYSNNCDASSVWEIDNKFSYNDKLKPTSHSIAHQKIINNNNTNNNNNNNYNNNNNSSESCTRSGYIHCPVCSTIRCYTTLQRRYGQFTCVACYRFFKEFFMKPTRFSCPSLGQCALDVKSKCKACWILACIKVYTVDGRRKSILDANTPIKSSPPRATSTKSNASSHAYQNENCKPKANPNDVTRSFLLPSLKDFGNHQESTIHEQNGSTALALLAEDPVVVECDEIMMEEEDTSSLLMGKDEDDKTNGYESSGTSSLTEKPIANGNKALTGRKIDRRSKTRVKNWCCLKCVNCLADDCGKCINCLDRPKFGGPFIRKQRCVNKKCLEKLQSETKA